MGRKTMIALIDALHDEMGVKYKGNPICPQCFTPMFPFDSEDFDWCCGYCAFKHEKGAVDLKKEEVKAESVWVHVNNGYELRNLKTGKFCAFMRDRPRLDEIVIEEEWIEKEK